MVNKKIIIIIILSVLYTTVYLANIVKSKDKGVPVPSTVERLNNFNIRK